ncbi:hypothetical protein BDR04DRAFT_1007410, partial [Suillus decipiens]
YIPLCKHLHCIGKEQSPHCSHCPHCPGKDKTVPHLLLNCPHYHQGCHTLTQALGRDASSLSFLLSDLAVTLHLVCFINSTGRLKNTLGVVPLPSKVPD